MKRPPNSPRNSSSSSPPRKRARRAIVAATPAREEPDIWARLNEILLTAESHFESKLPPTSTAHWAKAYADCSNEFSSPNEDHKGRVFRHVRAFIRQFVGRQRAALDNFSGLTLVSEYLRLWHRALKFMAHLKRIFFFMHRYWLPQNLSKSDADPVAPVDHLLVMFWRKDLLLHQKGFMDIVLNLIHEDRLGSPVDDGIIRAVLDNLVALGARDCSLMETEALTTPSSFAFYLDVFEELFLERTRDFYDAESRTIMASGSISTILRSIDKRIEDENQRCIRLIHAHSIPAVRAVVEQKLIGDHVGFLQQHASQMFCDERKSDLCILVRLLGRIVGALEPVRGAFISHIVEEGKLILQSHNFNLTPNEDFEARLPLVDELLKLHKRYVSMVRSCLPDLEPFVSAIDFAFRTVVNRPSQTRVIPVTLAFYADHMLSGIMPASVTNADASVEENVLAPQPPQRASVTNSHVHVADSSKSNTKDFGPTRTICPPAAPAEAHTSGTYVSRLRQLRRSPRLRKRYVSAVDDNTDDVSIIPAPSGLQYRVPNAVAQHMDHVIRLFVYIDEKDLFCEQFRCLLAKRLLGPFNENLAREFLSKLQDETGSVYTGKLMGMLNDIARNEGIEHTTLRSSEPRRKVKAKTTILDYALRSLNSMYWPKFPSDSLVLPPEVVYAEKAMTDHYRRYHPNRKLRWAHHQSRVIVTACFGKRTYTLDMSVFQASAMMLFNDTTRLSLADIATQLGVKPEIISRYLDAVVSGSGNPLLLRSVAASERGDGDATDNEIESSSSENSETSQTTGTPRKTRSASRKAEACSVPVPVSASDPVSARAPEIDVVCPKEAMVGPAPENVWYELNTEFYRPRLEIRFDWKDARSSPADAIAVRRTVFVERKTQIDAGVVRMLKMRKKLTFSAILDELTKQLAPDFVLEKTVVKERLEYLISSEFIARDAKCPDTYLYQV